MYALAPRARFLFIVFRWFVWLMVKRCCINVRQRLHRVQIRSVGVDNVTIFFFIFKGVREKNGTATRVDNVPAASVRPRSGKEKEKEASCVCV